MLASLAQPHVHKTLFYSTVMKLEMCIIVQSYTFLCLLRHSPGFFQHLSYFFLSLICPLTFSSSPQVALTDANSNKSNKYIKANFQQQTTSCFSSILFRTLYKLLIQLLIYSIFMTKLSQSLR